MNEIMAISRHRMGTDGNGITTLVAFYGCHLDCKYCINRQCKDDKTTRVYLSVEDLIKEFEIDDIYFRMTKGGVTFGGGEPLLASKYIRDFCWNVDKDWKVNIETSLNVDWDEITWLTPRVDKWYIDIKDMNPEIYKAYTGKDNHLVMENLIKLSREVEKEQIVVRTPYIEGFNTNGDIQRSIDVIEPYAGKIDRFDYIIY